MCVIAVKPFGTAIPSEETLKLMWDKNPDGAGFMYAHGNSVYIEKGFMTFEEIKNAILNFKDKFNTEDGKDIPMVFHFRITTHGGTSRENTHPFPISDNDEHLRALDVKAPLGMAHNGVISSMPTRTDLSDTMIFIKEIVTPLRRITSNFVDKYNLLLKTAVGSSRLVFLESSGKIKTVGTFTEEDGMLYSNTYFKPVAPSEYSSSYSWYKKHTPYQKDKVYRIGTSYKNIAMYRKYADKNLEYVSTQDSLYHSFKLKGVKNSEVFSLPNYAIEEYDVVEALPEPACKQEKIKDNMGGAKNKETAPLRQTGNHNDYKKTTQTLYLFELPLGYKIADYNGMKQGKNKNVVTIVSQNTWFLDENYDIFYYDKKQDLFYKIYMADTIYDSDGYLFFPDETFERFLVTYHKVTVLEKED